MHLADYMAKKGLSDEDVGAAIGRSRPSVSRYRRKLERPDWVIIQKIRLFSRGEVAEADWRQIKGEAPITLPRAASVRAA